MKIFKTVLAVAVTMALLCSPVLAVESIERSTGPEVVAATSGDKDITANLVTTSLGTTTNVAKVDDALAGAKADIDKAGKPAALIGTDGNSLEAALQDAIDKSGMNAKASDLTFAEVFDATLVDENGAPVTANAPVTATFKYQAPDGNFVIVTHSPVTGQWEVIDPSKVSIDGDNVTVTLDSLSPIAFLTAANVAPAKTEAAAVVNDSIVKSAQTGEHVAVYVVIIAVALAAAGVVCIRRAKVSAK